MQQILTLKQNSNTQGREFMVSLEENYVEIHVILQYFCVRWANYMIVRAKHNICIENHVKPNRIC